MTDFTVNAVARSDQGKGASRRQRHAGVFPAIVYGGGSDPVSISLQHNVFMHLLEDDAVYSSIINLDIDGDVQEVVLKDLQRHPYKQQLLHADFMRITRGQLMKATVPLHFENEEECAGVKEGGAVSHSKSEVEINVLPRNLPEYIAVDMTNVELGGVVHLSDLVLPEGAVILELAHGEAHDLPVATVSLPKVVNEDEDAPAAPVAEADEEEAGEE